MPVTIREATYSRVELVTAARSLIDANKGVMTSAGPNHDFSAVAITLSSKAPETATASVKAQSPVPIEFRGVPDIMPATHAPRWNARRASGSGSYGDDDVGAGGRYPIRAKDSRANREGPVGVITEVAATTGAIAAGLLKLWLAF